MAVRRRCRSLGLGTDDAAVELAERAPWWQLLRARLGHGLGRGTRGLTDALLACAPCLPQYRRRYAESTASHDSAMQLDAVHPSEHPSEHQHHVAT